MNLPSRDVRHRTSSYVERASNDVVSGPLQPGGRTGCLRLRGLTETAGHR